MNDVNLLITRSRTGYDAIPTFRTTRRLPHGVHGGCIRVPFEKRGVGTGDDQRVTATRHHATERSHLPNREGVKELMGVGDVGIAWNLNLADVVNTVGMDGVSKLGGRNLDERILD